MRKTIFTSPIAALLLICFLPLHSFAFNLTLNNSPAQVCFSPNGGCTETIVKKIDSATMEVLVQAYSFTSKPIAQALVNAKKRAVNVEAIMDKSQKTAKYTSATFLANMKIPSLLSLAVARKGRE